VNIIKNNGNNDSNKEVSSRPFRKKQPLQLLSEPLHEEPRAVPLNIINAMFGDD